MAPPGHDIKFVLLRSFVSNAILRYLHVQIVLENILANCLKNWIKIKNKLRSLSIQFVLFSKQG